MPASKQAARSLSMAQAVTATMGMRRPLPDSILVQFTKELPVTFRLPGKNPVTEQTVEDALAVRPPRGLQVDGGHVERVADGLDHDSGSSSGSFWLTSAASSLL